VVVWWCVDVNMRKNSEGAADGPKSIVRCMKVVVVRWLHASSRSGVGASDPLQRGSLLGVVIDDLRYIQED
jgi:hypothetical protein